jgi:ubiquinone/menaquinone biosynthesis C-methylase UbiE
LTSYAFDNAAAEATARFTALETCYDPASRARLRETGLAAGWRCWELGAGAGSIGLWLSEQVGPEGHVTVTDIAPQRIAPRVAARQNVEVLRHDVVRDPLPSVGFDLLHARLVLLHLPERLRVLARLVDALKPGGWLVLDEFDCGWTPVLRAPAPGAAELFEKVHAQVLDVLGEAGADVHWGRNAYRALTDAGLEQVEAVTFGTAWPGGGPGVSLHRANSEQLYDRLLARGVTETELKVFWALVENPGFAVHSYPMVTTRGRRHRDTVAELPR